MKKIITFALMFILFSIIANAQDCPRGETDCTLPCGLYDDNDNNGACDHELEPITQVQEETEHSKEPGHECTRARDEALGIPHVHNTETTLEPENKITGNAIFSRLFTLEKYPFKIILFTLVILYILTATLSRKDKIKVTTHRKIWNILLTISFLISAILGLLLVIRINTGFILRLPFNMLYWHVEAGIVMAIIAVFHIIWHWRYYAAILKFK